jgi:hypothetical protein
MFCLPDLCPVFCRSEEVSFSPHIIVIRHFDPLPGDELVHKLGRVGLPAGDGLGGCALGGRVDVAVGEQRVHAAAVTASDKENKH